LTDHNAVLRGQGSCPDASRISRVSERPEEFGGNAGQRGLPAGGVRRSGL